MRGVGRGDDHRIDVRPGEERLGGGIGRDAVLGGQRGCATAAADRHETSVWCLGAHRLRVRASHHSSADDAKADTHVNLLVVRPVSEVA